ncbi:MAG: hypothetical protein Q8R10_19615 [Pseudomonas sp.]|uniref:hypothetical protein n=1 Tax=Pseudomonas sp. TaxID=306 RepID=UPI0027363ADD|nr:hypothetical protein [Pseudomonas sp.]MDP3848633.1 hypothetical protein [Pseudomonas sp.]
MRLIDALGAIMGTIKAASVAAVAADTAVVVAISPNNVLRAGDGTSVAKVQLASVRPALADLSQTVSLSGNLGITTTLTHNSAATTNATIVKASAGTMVSLNASNIGAASAALKLHNKASPPTVGTDVPVLTIIIPPGATVSLDFGVLGRVFTTGIAFAITNLAADSDATAIAAGQVKLFGSYA